MYGRQASGRPRTRSPCDFFTRHANFPAPTYIPGRMTLADPEVTVLGPDPSHRNCVLNGNAFQQDAVQSCNGWQYACFYASLPGSDVAATAGAVEPLFVHLARRRLPRGPWETLVFDDYPQTTDDGHNTVQVRHKALYRAAVRRRRAGIQMLPIGLCDLCLCDVSQRLRGALDRNMPRRRDDTSVLRPSLR